MCWIIINLTQIYDFYEFKNKNLTISWKSSTENVVFLWTQLYF